MYLYLKRHGIFFKGKCNSVLKISTKHPKNIQVSMKVPGQFYTSVWLLGIKISWHLPVTTEACVPPLYCLFPDRHLAVCLSSVSVQCGINYKAHMS